MNAPRSSRVDIDGWLVLDKPVGMTSTHAVGRLKRLFNAKKAGHAGTLDPLASGVLPIAFGEATKTVPYVQDGEKAYRFTAQWGEETDTDDCDGAVVETSDRRPVREAIEALLPRFTGLISQVPPAYSAIKINGERAYDLARAGDTPTMQPRDVSIHALRLVTALQDSVDLETECGKGTYVRAIARDLGRVLGCLGHVSALRRTRVGPFLASTAVAWDDLQQSSDDARSFIQPVEAGLSEIACVAVDRNAAARLRRGQSVLLRGRDAPAEGPAYAACGGIPIAVGIVTAGELVPGRVFNMPY